MRLFINIILKRLTLVSTKNKLTQTMKKTCFLFFVLLLANFKAQHSFNCSSHLWYEEQMKNDPEFRKNQEALEKETQEFIKNNAAQRSAPATYIIPVVFHVIHTGGSGNISDAQIMDQINILNKEFPRQQADTILTPAAFKPLAAPFSVEFRLATKDPNGNCTNGINRIYSTLSNCSYNNDDVKSLSYWPSNKYLNIWLVQSMHYSNSMTCDGGGYATFPGGSATIDGINIRGDLISSIGTSATNIGWGNFKGRYLMHELGHWFNLRHIWGDANCGNDLVNDTPPHVNSNSGCPTFPHNPNNSCGGNANGEMFNNYMDYTEGNCLNMFTAGQVARMTAAINSGVSGRSNLWSPSNLIATGTSNPYIYPVACPSIPDVLTVGPIVTCVGQDVVFTDNSYGGISDSRLWDFAGESASSLTDSVVNVTYLTPGIYFVGLTKNYLSASKTTTFVNKVYVIDDMPNANYVFPYQDSFEDSFGFGNDWVVVNNDNDSVQWELVNTTGYYGSQCISVKNFGKPAPLVDEVISPAFDLSAIVTPTLTFRLHFATTSTDNYDKLQVLISSNCGQTWTSMYLKTGTTLRTVPGHVLLDNTPAMQSTEWRLEKINIPAHLANGVVRFKFVFTNGGGNNIFLDDINIDGFNTSGVAETFFNGGINLFPNPANESVNLKFNLKEKSAVQVEVTDVLGKMILRENVESIQGENTHVMSTKYLDNGVYFVRITQNDAIIYASKFVKEAK
jgi:hypothetical protein